MDACAKQGGGVVSVPAGRYLIKTHLTIPRAVTLEGTWRAPASVTEYHDPSDPNGAPLLSGSVLLAVEGAGNPDGTPFIYLDRDATIKGVTVFYPEQTKTDPPIAYPWCIAKFMLEKGEAFVFGRSDWEYVTNCFAISYHVGMRFIKGQPASIIFTNAADGNVLADAIKLVPDR